MRESRRIALFFLNINLFYGKIAAHLNSQGTVRKMTTSDGLPAEEAKNLSDEQAAVYINISKEQAAEYDKRRLRVSEISQGFPLVCGQQPNDGI
jgi:hypothetical protein